MVFEVKVLKVMKYLPNVFMVKHSNGMVSKISVMDKKVMDCSQYISLSGMTFNGCFKFKGGNLKETRGIYYTPIAPKFTVSSRNKVSRNIENMKGLILNTLENYGLEKSELFISYDNNGFTAYDRFYKGELYQFDSVFNHSNLEIYRVPPLKTTENLKVKVIDSIKYHDYEINFSTSVESTTLFSRNDTVYIIYPRNNITDVRIKTPSDGEHTITLRMPNWIDNYLITFW